MGKVGHDTQIPEDVFKNGKIGGICVLACQQWNDQDRFLPPRMEPELGSQVPCILTKDMEGAYSPAFL